MTMRRPIFSLAIIALTCLFTVANAYAAPPIPHKSAAPNQALVPVSLTKLPPVADADAVTPAAGVDVGAGEKTLVAKDADENAPLADYPIGARIAIGEIKTYV